MAINLQKYLDSLTEAATSENVFGTGGNIFGATKPRYTGRLKDLGLINKEDLEEAKKRSLYSGLLSAGFDYITTPKNKNYGSILPYLGKAAKAGIASAQTPYDDLTKNAMTNNQLNTLERTINADKARKKLFKTSPAQSVNVRSLDTSNLEAIEQLQPDGTTALRPNFGKVTNNTYDLPQKKEVDMAAVRDYALQFPNEGGTEMMSVLKAEADINVANRPDGDALESKGKQWDKMVRSGNTGPWGSFADYLADNTVKAGVQTAEKISNIYGETVKNLQGNFVSNMKVADQVGVIATLLKGKKGGEIVKLSADIQQFLGLNTDTTDVSQLAEALRTRGGVAVRAPGSGSTSDLEFNAYMKSFPSLSMTEDGRKMMAFLAKRSAERSGKLADFAMKMYKEGSFNNKKLYDYDKSLGRLVSKDIEEKIRILSDKGTREGDSPYVPYDPLFNEVDAIIAEDKDQGSL